MLTLHTSDARATPHPFEALQRRLAARPPRSPAEAAACLAGLELDVSDLAPWADFGHPVADSYGRRLVFGAAGFELMVMSWLPGDYSAVHDHGATRWGAVRYFGEADHVVFELRRGALGIAERMRTAVGTVYPVDHSLIHLMGNPTDAPFLSVHLYGTPEPTPAVTADARIFELLEGRIQRTDGGVFFALPEAEITRREPCPPAEPATLRLHHELMAARLQRIRLTGRVAAADRARAAALEARLAAAAGLAARR